MSRSLSRRETLRVLRNIGVATFAGGALLVPRKSTAQQATAVLGHFGSANPQTFGKATGAFMRDTLAPLVTPYTKVYQELRSAIFGDK